MSSPSPRTSTTWDKEAYEYGGQFFGGSLFSGWGTVEGTRLVTRLTGYLSPMAAVNADYSFLADVGNPQRFREYDYGPGIGVGAEAVIARRGRPFLAVSYRYTYINVSNGSIWNPDDPVEIELPGGPEEIVLEGSDARHHVHRVGVRLLVPFGDTWGVGADARLKPAPADLYVGPKPLQDSLRKGLVSRAPELLRH